MIICTYDGSFEGLMSLFSECISKNIQPENIIEQSKYEPDLINEELFMPTNISAANSFRRRLRNALSAQSLKHLFFVFLSALENKEICMYRYALFGLQAGFSLNKHLTDKRVAMIHDVSLKVGCEAHRMKGLLRFRELDDGRYYAPVRTDHFVLPILASHFSKRLSTKQWVIHDVPRSTAALFDRESWYITKIEQTSVPELSQDELHCQSLWRQYFSAIAIKERINPKLQRQFLPKRYWDYLVEMQDAPAQENNSSDDHLSS
ncbi:MAG: TIGR03915 family putative DNA repair protein [Candidatus Auribacterota bacterium]